MLAAHPFTLFKNYFTVYVVHVTQENQTLGLNGYLGTVNPWGGVRPETTRHYRIIELANSLVVNSNHVNMIQVIANSTELQAYAWLPLPPLYEATVTITSIMTGKNPPGGRCSSWCGNSDCERYYDGTLWHNFLIHEFGHSFGNLVDEREFLRWWPPGNENNANFSNAPDESIKWRHWFGHRNVAIMPPRYHGRAVPTGYGCIMRGANIILVDGEEFYECISSEFCGVCAAQLIRRMASVTGEVFEGRRPNGDIPNLFAVAIPITATRILDSAFHGNTALQTITISETVDSIGDFAFLGATGLRTINNNSIEPQQINCTTFAGVNKSLVTLNLPAGADITAWINAGWGGFIFRATQVAGGFRIDGIRNGFNFPSEANLLLPERINGLPITEIRTFAFANQPQLTRITLPSTITQIGCSAFFHTPALEYIEACLHNNHFSSVGGVLLNKEQTKLIRFPAGKTVEYPFEFHIPSTVTATAPFAFQDAIFVNSFHIPSSVQAVGADAFSGLGPHQTIFIGLNYAPDGWCAWWYDGASWVSWNNIMVQPKDFAFWLTYIYTDEIRVFYVSRPMHLFYSWLHAALIVDHWSLAPVAFDSRNRPIILCENGLGVTPEGPFFRVEWGTIIIIPHACSENVNTINPELGGEIYFDSTHRSVILLQPVSQATAITLSLEFTGDIGCFPVSGEYEFYIFIREGLNIVKKENNLTIILYPYSGQQFFTFWATVPTKTIVQFRATVEAV